MELIATYNITAAVRNAERLRGWRKEPTLAYQEIKKYRAYGCGLQPIIIHYGLRRISSCM